MVGEEGLSSSSSPVLQAPRIDHAAMEASGAGLKRGLLEALLQLSMPQEVGSWVDKCWTGSVGSWLGWLGNGSAPELGSCSMAHMSTNCSIADMFTSCSMAVVSTCNTPPPPRASGGVVSHRC
jgi:hypothetical protein